MIRISKKDRIRNVRELYRKKREQELEWWKVCGRIGCGNFLTLSIHACSEYQAINDFLTDYRSIESVGHPYGKEDIQSVINYGKREPIIP